MSETAVTLRDLSKTFQKTGPPVLDAVTADLPAGTITGVVGPDAAGKTTLMRLMAGLLRPSRGEARIFGLPAVAPGGGSQPFVGYMPQKFALYEDLSVMDNLRLHARLRDVPKEGRKELFERLLAFTSLAPFTKRLAGRLSGGMKQKLGLACSLLGTPRVLLLDEPGVGVDPQSRRELWKMVHNLSADGMTVVWSTAYMDEAERCAWVLMLDGGRLLHAGSPAEFLNFVKGRTFFLRCRNGAGALRQTWREWSDKAGSRDVLVQGSNLRVLLAEDADRTADGGAELVPAPPRLEDAYMDIVGGISKNSSPFSSFPEVWNREGGAERPVIEATGLTKNFGSFVAARDISFQVMPGQIFGLLGPNGAGKSTTFRMLCGLSRPNRGTCHVDGVNLLLSGSRARSRLGYMAQKFSLYGDISAERNIRLYGDLYNMPRHEFVRRRSLLVEALDLEPYLRMQAQNLPLGQKQRLALLCATLHGPRALFLDEPTSGVDPRTRREFWKHINALTGIGVAVLVTTHFMEEAEYCDEIALVYQGRIIASGTPDNLKSSARSPEMPDPALEDAFIACIENFARENPV